MKTNRLLLFKAEACFTGYVQHVRQEGFIFKHWEVSMVERGNEQMSSYEYRVFSLSSLNNLDQDISILNRARNVACPISLSYYSRLFNFPWKSNVIGAEHVVDIKSPYGFLDKD